MKKTVCLSIIILLFLSGNFVWAEGTKQFNFREAYRIGQEYGNDVYNAYRDGYEEGYTECKALATSENRAERSQLIAIGREQGYKEGVRDTEIKYQGSIPWWTNLITGISVAAVCSGVFLIIWIVKKKKAVSFPLKANHPIEVQDQSVQLKNPFIEAKEALKERMPK